MPLYEYECGTCGHRQEKIVPSFDTVPPPCDACGMFAMERVQFSKATGPDGLAIFFRGSGWAKDGYNK